MPVETRLIQSVAVGDLTAIGAVDTGRAVHIGYPADTRPEAVRAAFDGPGAILRSAGSSLLASLPTTAGPETDPDETGLFRGMRVLVAFRNGETAAAAADWLSFHHRLHGAEAALIFDRDPPGGAFSAQLAELAPALPVVVVSADTPLGLPGAPDARRAAFAPAAPRRDLPPPDPWHAPLAQLVIYELLRRRFLSAARSVAFLAVSDMVLDGGEAGVFDTIEAARGRMVLFHGMEAYPWRLRRGAPAPHSDHIAIRRNERRWLSSWGTVPAGLPEEAVWKPVRVGGALALAGAPVKFRRALGVTFPGVPVQKLVAKSDLVEDPVLLDLVDRGFERAPIRLPRPVSIPARPDMAAVTIVTAMKNEAPFILDWIAHNRAIGIDRHLVYTNDCADGTDRLLDLLADAGVTRRDNPYRALGKVPQHAAFRAAETESAVTGAGWLLTLDVDEYIDIRTGEGRVSDLLAARPDAHLFSMPWRLFGNADRHAFDDRPVTGLFARAAPEYAPRPLQAWAFKTLYRNAGLFRRLGVHRPKGLVETAQAALRWVDGSGRDLPPNVWRSCWRMSKANWGYDLVSINHYAVRSAESFLVKRDRGRVNHVDRDQGQAYWFRMNHNAVEDLSIRRLDARTTAEKAKLLSLPGVAEAHEAGVAWHRDRIAALRAMPDHAELYAAITSHRMENLSRMSTRFGSAVHFFGPHVIPDEIACRDPTEEFFFTVDPAGHVQK